MHIFVTNDDGVAAPGIRTLARALSALAKITVIAPAEGVSSCSSALSLRKPMKLKKQQSYGENIEVYSLTGTTGDCCKLALEYWLKDDLPDLIVSGINDGFNTGSDCLYSGTVAGALEGIFAGIPSMAVSMESMADGTLLRETAAFAADLVSGYFMKKRYTGILNVNIPKIKPEKVSWKNVKVARLGLLRYSNVIAGKRTEADEMEFIMRGKPLERYEPETDVYWSRKGYITITPLQWNQTDFENLSEVGKLTAAFIDA